jgi:hypothetical protein
MLFAPEFRDAARLSDKNKKGADRSRRITPDCEQLIWLIRNKVD